MRIHMIGICGISMRGLAKYLAETGNEVTGCDVSLDELPGQEVLREHDVRHIQDIDQVIINSAVTESHPGWKEVEAANAAGIPVIKRAVKIGEITHSRKTITVSGAHGKTTTTGMVAHVLREAGHDPFVMIGAPLREFGDQSYIPGKGPLVLEADEYDRSFLQFSPDIAVITNIDADHLDYFTGGLPQIKSVFAEFMAKLKPGGVLVLNGDDGHIREIVTLHPELSKNTKIIWYGRNQDASYRIEHAEIANQTNQFDLLGPDNEQRHIKLAVAGAYNQENATAGLIVGQELGISDREIIAALATYTGVGLRLELRGEVHGIRVLSDYGHHPTEVRVTLDAARAWFSDKRIVLVFQPHQYARTKIFFNEFIEALGHADKVIVTDIYGVAGREEDRTVSAEELAKRATTPDGHGQYVPLATLAQTVVREAEPNDVIIFMGAGLDIRGIANEVVEQLASRHE